MTRRVVVTGIGLISPIGNSVDVAFENAMKGQHGFSVVPALDEARPGGKPVPVTLGGRVVDYDPELTIDKKDAKRMDPFMQYALSSTAEAWKMAGLPDRLENDEGERGATLYGVGLAGVQHILDVQTTIRERGPRRVSPLFIPSVIGNLAPGYIGMRYNIRGANWTPASAGASGAHAIGEGFHYIKDGRADFVVAGGSESVLCPLVVCGFNNMGVITHDTNADSAVRPFDEGRTGTLLGEGGAVFILEEYERAKKRGAKILAELVGYGAANDKGSVGFDPKGDGLTRAVNVAFSSSGRNISDLGYINANATGTKAGDAAEAAAYRGLLGANAKNVAISSTKSMTGEMLAASGAAEALFAVAALSRGKIPSTAGLKKIGADIDLDVVGPGGREKALDLVLSTTFGSGGTNTALLFAQPQ